MSKLEKIQKFLDMIEMEAQQIRNLGETAEIDKELADAIAHCYDATVSIFKYLTSQLIKKEKVGKKGN